METSTGNMRTDRRRHRRRPVRLAVGLEPIGRDPVVQCETIDLSCGGARLRSTLRLPPGWTVLVVIELEHDDTPPLVIRGDVLEEIVDVTTGWVDARVAFRNISDGTLERLAEVVEVGAATQEED